MNSHASTIPSPSTIAGLRSGIAHREPSVAELLNRLEPVETVELYGVRATTPDGDECDLWFATEHDQLDELDVELDRGHTCRLLSTVGRIIVGRVIVGRVIA